MSENSGLAAVHAAAATTQPPAQPTAAATAAEFHAAYPEAYAHIRTEAANAERARILGIEAHALQGHEQLIAEMKADPAVGPDQAAARILSAEKAARSAQMSAIKGVEDVTGKVPAAPTTAVTRDDRPLATDPEGWRAEYAASSALKAEFASAEDYVGYKQAEASGKVRVLKQKTV